MTGVEILSSETIYNTNLPEWCFIIGMVLGTVSILVAVMLAADYYHIAGIIVAVFAVICFVFAIFGIISNENSINHIEYKVTIDDSVSMNEFLDKYEILDQEGKIYTVKEKE